MTDIPPVGMLGTVCQKTNDHDKKLNTMNNSIDDNKVNEVKTQLSLLAKNLLDALEDNDRAEALAAQQAFTSTIAALWGASEEFGIDPKIKAVLRLVVGWAIYELPNQIQDPDNDNKIKRELKIFRNSLILVG